MFLFDLLGAALTLVAVATLLLGGYLLALALLRERAVADPLALAVATLLGATAQAVGVGPLLGTLRVLRFPYALAVELGVVVVLLVVLRRRGFTEIGPAPLLASPLLQPPPPQGGGTQSPAPSENRAALLLDSAGLGAPARLALRRTWAQLACHPALAILTLHAIASEALRGLL